MTSTPSPDHLPRALQSEAPQQRSAAPPQLWSWKAAREKMGELAIGGNAAGVERLRADAENHFYETKGQISALWAALADAAEHAESLRQADKKPSPLASEAEQGLGADAARAEAGIRSLLEWQGRLRGDWPASVDHLEEAFWKSAARLPATMSACAETGLAERLVQKLSGPQGVRVDGWLRLASADAPLWIQENRMAARIVSEAARSAAQSATKESDKEAMAALRAQCALNVFIGGEVDEKLARETLREMPSEAAKAAALAQGLRQSAIGNTPRALEWLLAQGAANSAGAVESALEWASAKATQRLLEEQVDWGQCRALARALTRGEGAIALALLDAGASALAREADESAQEGSMWGEPLAGAASFGSLGIKPNDGGQTAARWVRKLLEMGAQAQGFNQNGAPLRAAFFAGNEAAARALMAAGAGVSQDRPWLKRAAAGLPSQWQTALAQQALSKLGAEREKADIQRDLAQRAAEANAAVLRQEERKEKLRALKAKKGACEQRPAEDEKPQEKPGAPDSGPAQEAAGSRGIRRRL